MFFWCFIIFDMVVGIGFWVLKRFICYIIRVLVWVCMFSMYCKGVFEMRLLF